MNRRTANKQRPAVSYQLSAIRKTSPKVAISRLTSIRGVYPKSKGLTGRIPNLYPKLLWVCWVYTQFEFGYQLGLKPTLFGFDLGITRGRASRHVPASPGFQLRTLTPAIQNRDCRGPRDSHPSNPKPGLPGTPGLPLRLRPQSASVHLVHRFPFWE
jgi:hypothetical protein